MYEDTHLLADTVKKAAKDAGALLAKGYSGIDRVTFERKGASDFVTHYDQAAERLIIDDIRQHFPSVGFLGEESGASPANNSNVTVIIDPLDGTNNFLHGVPFFSVSIAVEQNNELIMGAVYHPLLDELIWAEKGQGAYLNDHRLICPSACPLTEMLVATCLPYHGKGDCDLSIRQQAAIMPHVSGIRSPGSAALEIAYVALGRFDAFWSQGAKLEWWDVAAGILIAQEVGLMVTGIQGQAEASCLRQSLLIAPSQSHQQLLALLNEA